MSAPEKLTGAMADTLEALSDGRRAEDVHMLVFLGPQWRRTLLGLERRGLVEANRNGWKITELGRAAFKEYQAAEEGAVR